MEKPPPESDGEPAAPAAEQAPQEKIDAWALAHAVTFPNDEPEPGERRDDQEMTVILHLGRTPPERR